MTLSVRCLASEVAAAAQEQQEVAKSSGKPLRNVPFVKDVFLGKFDKVGFLMNSEVCGLSLLKTEELID